MWSLCVETFWFGHLLFYTCICNTATELLEHAHHDRHWWWWPAFPFHHLQNVKILKLKKTYFPIIIIIKNYLLQYSTAIAVIFCTEGEVYSFGNQTRGHPGWHKKDPTKSGKVPFMREDPFVVVFMSCSHGNTPSYQMYATFNLSLKLSHLTSQ